MKVETFIYLFFMRNKSIKSKQDTAKQQQQTQLHAVQTKGSIFLINSTRCGLATYICSNVLAAHDY